MTPIASIKSLRGLAKRLAHRVRQQADTHASQITAFAEFLHWLEPAESGAGAGHSLYADIFGVADRQRILKQFSQTRPLEDIRIHFCEALLANSQPQHRRRRGMYYTPQAVATFMVRGIDEILTKHFRLEDGIASEATWGEVSRKFDLRGHENVEPAATFLRFLDPAAGAGVFPLEIVRQIHAKLLKRWQNEKFPPKQIRQRWRQYVQRLLPRLHGYELMPAASVISRLLICDALRQTDYDVSPGDLANFRCISGLHPPTDARDNGAPPFTVVTGNPPYSNYASGNDHPWILQLLEDYKRGLNERKLNLNDDFIKFMRRAQYDLQQSAGVLMFVTNNTYMLGVTHRRMRESLQHTFPVSYLLNLHGSGRQGPVSASGNGDESVFEGIQQGTCIGAFVRVKDTRQTHLAELRGCRADKLNWLQQTPFFQSGWKSVTPQSPGFYYSELLESHAAEYKQHLSICDLFGIYGPGLKTERDAIAIQHSREEMREVLEDFRQLSIGEIREKYQLPPDSRDWKVESAKRDVIDNWDENVDARIQPVLYRPFDTRFTFYSGRTRGFVGTPGAAHMRHMLGGDNLALHCSRTVYGDAPWRDIFVTNTLSEFGVLAARPGNTAPLFPAYLYPASGGAMVRKARRTRIGDTAEPGEAFDALVWPAGKDGRRPNFQPAAITRFEESSGLKFQPCGAGDLQTTFGPDDIIYYIYAVLSSNAYRSRYNALLKLDYPRIPLPTSISQFKDLVHTGRTLSTLHSMQNELPVRTHFTGSYPVTIKRGFPRYEDGRVWLNDADHLEDVPREVWEHFVGGYQICRKWLQDRAPRGGKRPRKVRLLNEPDVQRYQQIVATIAETLRVITAIDGLIELDAH